MRPGTFAIPLVPLLLTLSGLLPFIGSAAVMAARGDDPVLQSQAGFLLLAYGAVILSFLGGVRWGVAMTGGGSEGASDPPEATVSFVVSVIGALVGWAVVGLSVLSIGVDRGTLFLALAAALALHWSWDVLSSDRLAAWYAGLRTIATVGAVASLLTAWWFS